MIHKGNAVGVLDDHLRLGKARLNIPLFDLVMADNVALPLPDEIGI